MIFDDQFGFGIPRFQLSFIMRNWKASSEQMRESMSLLLVPCLISWATHCCSLLIPGYVSCAIRFLSTLREMEREWLKRFDVIMRTVFVVIAMDFILFAREIDFGNWKNRVWRIAQSFTVVQCNGRNRSTAHIAIASVLETCSSVHLLGASFFVFHREWKEYTQIQREKNVDFSLRSLSHGRETDAFPSNRSANIEHIVVIYQLHAISNTQHTVQHRIQFRKIPIAIDDRSFAFLSSPDSSFRAAKAD